MKASGDNEFINDDIFLHSFFILNDPEYHAGFVQLLNQTFDGLWVVRDLSGGFDAISTSMQNMNEIADMILFGTINATILIISLIVVLFLLERNYEIGIYLAMGQKKYKIIVQIMCELIPVAVIGLGISLIFGNLVASSVSESMLRQDMVEATNQSQQFMGYADSLSILGYSFEMSIDEMIESYEISIDSTMIFIFMTIGITTIIITILIPVLSIVLINPKKLLMMDKQ